DLVPSSPRRPLLDAAVELGIVARPFGMADYGAEELPFRFGPDAQGDPAVLARAAVYAVRARDEVAVAVACGKSPVRGVLQQRRRHELEPCLVPREIDDAAFAGAAASFERREDRDDAVAHRDVVDVGPVENDGRPATLAEKLVEARERCELAAVAGVLRMRSRLALIAARQDHEIS